MYKGKVYLWDYVPNLPAAVVFAFLFALLTMVHTWKMIRLKMWFCIPFIIGGFCMYANLVMSSKLTRASIRRSHWLHKSSARHEQHWIPDTIPATGYLPPLATSVLCCHSVHGVLPCSSSCRRRPFLTCLTALVHSHFRPRRLVLPQCSVDRRRTARKPKKHQDW